MGGGLIVAGDVADQIADSLEQVSFSGATPLVSPTRSSLYGLTEGVSLGNSLHKTFDGLKDIVDSKAENLRQITANFIRLDRELAERLR